MPKLNYKVHLGRGTGTGSPLPKCFGLFCLGMVLCVHSFPTHDYRQFTTKKIKRLRIIEVREDDSWSFNVCVLSYDYLFGTPPPPSQAPLPSAPAAPRYSRLRPSALDLPPRRNSWIHQCLSVCVSVCLFF